MIYFYLIFNPLVSLFVGTLWGNIVKKLVKMHQAWTIEHVWHLAKACLFVLWLKVWCKKHCLNLFSYFFRMIWVNGPRWRPPSTPWPIIPLPFLPPMKVKKIFNFFSEIKFPIKFQKYKIISFFFRRPRRQAARKSQSGNTHGGLSTMYSKYLRSYPIYSYDLDCGHSRSSSGIFCCFCGLLCGKLSFFFNAMLITCFDKFWNYKLWVFLCYCDFCGIFLGFFVKVEKITFSEISNYVLESLLEVSI